MGLFPRVCYLSYVEDVMRPIKVVKTETRIRAQDIGNLDRQYDNCDVCGKLCNENRYCIGDNSEIHFDVCSVECGEMGIFQRI